LISGGVPVQAEAPLVRAVDVQVENTVVGETRGAEINCTVGVAASDTAPTPVAPRTVTPRAAAALRNFQTQGLIR